MAALTSNDPAFQPGFADADTSVVAAVPLYGRYDWFSTEGNGRRNLMKMLERWVVKRSLAEHHDVFIDASPIRRVHAGAPPLLVLHDSPRAYQSVDAVEAFLSRVHETRG